MQLETSLRKEKQDAINVAKGLPPMPAHLCGAHMAPQMMDAYQELQGIEGCPLEYEIELLQVQNPGDYEREPWEMSTHEKYVAAPCTKDEGNELYKKGDYKGALVKYTRALQMLESLAKSREIQDLKRTQNLKTDQMERDQWIQKQDQERGVSLTTVDKETAISQNELSIEYDPGLVEKLDLTTRLNYAACQLKLGDYSPVIIQCSEVLNREPKNVKALFRRGQAYFSLGRDLDLASKDFSLIRTILEKDLLQSTPEWTDLLRMEKSLCEKFKIHEAKEKQAFSSMFKN